MRITKKIISLLLVVSMLASFLAMTGFEASAALTGQQKTDFGLQFDDTTRKFKVLQLSDIQTDVGDSKISAKARDIIRMAMELYNPDLIMLSGDQTQGGKGIFGDGSTIPFSDWQDSIDKVFATFTPYMKTGCKVVAVPGNHEYDWQHLGDQWEYYNEQSWYLDWDNNFSTVDLNGEPGAGNVTVAAGKGSDKVALNIAMFNSKGDDENGYLRPGGDDDAAYQQIVDWFKATDTTLSSNTYSYKAQVTGASSAQVPTFGMQHVILQEIFNSLEACEGNEGIDNTIEETYTYSYLLDCDYMRFKTNLSYTGTLGEGPCPSTLGAGSTRALYDALLSSDFLGMCFGHDHLNTFDITDAEGFRFLMGGALTSENYNNGDPNVRYMEFTLDDTTGNVTLESEIKSYYDMTVSDAVIDNERIEALNADGAQLVNTFSVPRTIYVGAAENNTGDVRNTQEFGNVPQAQLLDYSTKNADDQDLTIKGAVPTGSTFTYYSANCNGREVSLAGDWVITTEGSVDIWENKISTDASNILTIGDRIEYIARYVTPGGQEYEIRSVSYVESIKQPAGYADWSRSYRKASGHSDLVNDTTAKSENWIDVTAVQTLSGNNVYATARETDPADNGGYSTNMYVKYGPGFESPDDRIVYHDGDTRFPMMYYDPDRQAGGNGLLRMNGIDDPAANDIYIDVSRLGPVAENDPRLDLGVRIDYWLMKDTDNEFPNHAAGIGFYDGDLDYAPNAPVVSGLINPSTGSVYTYQDLIKAELDSNAGEDGTLDQVTTFLYDGYAQQQSNRGIGTTHVNSNTDSGTYIGKIQGNMKGYPLVADSVESLYELDGEDMTMFTGVRVKGHNSSQNQHMVHLIAPYYLRFHVFDKSAIRTLVMQEIANPRMRSDYPKAAEGAEKAYLWDDYMEAFYVALSYYARTDVTSQDVIDLNRKVLINAIAALERSNLEPDTSAGLSGKAPLTSVSVPPILYVNSSKEIQTSSPYTNTKITVNVPNGASEVKIIALASNSDGSVQLDANGDEVVNTNIKFTGGTAHGNGTATLALSNNTATVSIASGSTATADTDDEEIAADTTANGDGYVYYKITYKDANGNEHQTYAASYVRATTYYLGEWRMRNTRETNKRYDWGKVKYFYDYASAMYDAEVDAGQALGLSGASSVVALYPIQSNDSFSDMVNYPHSVPGNIPHGDSSYMDGSEGDIGWAIGTDDNLKHDYGNDHSSWRYSNKVIYYNDRGRADQEYWIGLGTTSKEYIVAHYYYDKQAVDSTTKIQTKITYKHGGNYDTSGRNADSSYNDTAGRQLWTLKIGDLYQGWPGDDATLNSVTQNNSHDGANFIKTHTGNVLEYDSGSTIDNTLSSSSGNLSGTIQNEFDLSSVAVVADTNGYKRGSKSAAGYIQRYKNFEGQWLSSSTGYGFVFNAVDRSNAHEWINKALTRSLNEADLMPEYWATYRQELLKAYVACGNLWGKDFDKDALETLMTSDGIYRRASYKTLIDAINKVATEANGTQLLTLNSDESIADYDALLYNVYPGDAENGIAGDDQRYVGYSYDNTMFESNARDLIELIQGRVEVYESVVMEASGDIDVGDPLDESVGNLHLAHMDFRYEYLIEEYAQAILDEWAKLRLADADYTDFNKYVNYVNFDRQLIRFHRDDHAAYAKHSEDAEMRNYANEKSLDYAIFTTKSRQAFVAAVNLPADQLNLKKPSEQAAIPAADDSGIMPQIYPKNYNFTFAYGVENPDTTECLYNTARDAYEELEFRRAVEYYTEDGTHTEDGVTYYANYNMLDRGSSYYYTPIFKTSENSLTSEYSNRGYGVINKAGHEIYDTYTAGNTPSVEVLSGAGEVTKKLPPWTDASWGTSGYGFEDAFVDTFSTNSHYLTTNAEGKYEYALYVEDKICQEIANTDYYYDNLVRTSFDISQLEIQQTTPAYYEKGGAGYDAIAGYEILDANGNVLTDGAQWYKEDVNEEAGEVAWSDYLAVKSGLPSIMDGATLAENQKIINDYTQKIYQMRQALVLRPMEDYKTSTAVLDDAKDFASINDRAQYYYDLVNNKMVKVFSLRPGTDGTISPNNYDAIAGNDPLFKDHNYYNSNYITTLQGLLDNDAGTGVKDFAGKDMATSIAAYISAVNTFKAKYDENVDPANMNKADTSTLQILLNKTWIPTYDKFGAGNYNNGSFLIGSEFDGSKWYSNWDQYDTARKNALSFFNQTEFDGQTVVVTLTPYGDTKYPAGDFYVDKQGAEFTVDKTEGSATYGQPIAVDGSDLTGTVNKVAYDLVVAYYRLQLKKVADSDDEIGGISGYENILADMNTKLELLKNAKVDVLTVDTDTSSATFGQLITVQRSTYDEAYINTLQTYYNTVAAMEEEVYASNYTTYIQTVQNFNTKYAEPVAAKIYLDGWNSFYEYFTIKAGKVGPITNDSEVDVYFAAIFGDNYNIRTNYDGDEDNYTIRSIRTRKSDNISEITTGTDKQPNLNEMVELLYNEFTSVNTSSVPTQVQTAAKQAGDVISNTSGNAYDPLQLNNRPQVTGITEYTQDSMDALEAIIDANSTYKVTFWEADPSQTGYNDKAGIVVDGSYADNMWAAAGLTTESGVEYAADKSVNDRYVLVKGGRFLDALKDAIAYAELALYKNTDGEFVLDASGNKVIKDFTVLKGDGTVDYTAVIFTDGTIEGLGNSVEELTDALEVGYGILAETEGNYTDQAGIDQAVFDILEESDIKNELDLKVKNADGTAGGFYGTLGHKAEDEGLKYKPADLTYFNEELATKYSYANMSDAAKALVDAVWVDSDNDGDFDFASTRNQAYQYFNNELWNAYDTDAYADALAVKTENATTPLTAADQDKVNNSATAVYTARNALEWNVIDTHLRWQDAQDIGAAIETLSSKKVFVNVFANSELSADGTYLTAPSTTQVEASEYGQEAINTITTMWQEFQDKYPSGSDYANYVQMVADYEKLNAAYSNLAAKPMSVDSDFAEGAKDLVDNFIAGTYDFTTGIYVADYQTTIATGLSDAEITARETQYNTIKGYLDEIRELLNGKNTINDPSKYTQADGTTPMTYLEALNDRTMKLYEYVTTTPAQYAGFALDMRQNMIDYFNTTIDVAVSARGSAANDEIIYQKQVRVFKENAATSAINNVNNQLKNAAFYPTINLLDDYVNLDLAEDVNYTQYQSMTVESKAEDGTITTSKGLNVYRLLSVAGAYSQYYTLAATTAQYANVHDKTALTFLTTKAVCTVDEKTYILADPATAPMPDGSTELYYAMDIDHMFDGEWYTEGYGMNILSDGDMYYLAAGETVTGSEAGGWFTDVSYTALTEAIKQANTDTSYYGKDANAAAVNTEIKAGDRVSNYFCWNAENRAKFINAIKADQQLIDESTALVYEAIAALQLLPATDAYREVAGLIYAAMGKVPSYSDDDKSGVIINNSSVGTLTDYKIGDDVCGQVFNTALLTQLGKENEGYYVVSDENGTRYYAPGLPAGYTNGVEDVDKILAMLQTEVDTPVTVDKAVLVSDNTANNGINSVKEKILAELEKLTLGLADLSLITSLTKAFLYNNPSHEESLGSYPENSEFFVTTHYDSELGKTGNAEKYKNDPLMKLADDAYHASGFYDFSKYTTTSLNAVITYLQLNYIITGETASEASNFDIDNKTGFNIVFGESNYGTAYSTAVTQQQKIDEIYAGLVSVINNLELRAADTVALKAEIEEAEEIKLNKDLYDYESDEGKAAWNEFIEASQVASSYENATVINEKQVEEAENELSRAIKALKLNVDSYAPVVTIHNTQSDLTKFHDAHKELKAIISDSDDMVAPSYMEPGLGGYTLYVYTNQINPHIVVSLKDATVAANGDGSTREVKASKPEKMTVTAQAMSGVTASVITPVFDANGVAESAQKVAIAGATVDATSASTQTAKTLVKDAEGNETYNYAAGSSAYIVLNPSFEGVEDGAQSAVAYSINATDSAVEKVANGEDDFNIVPKENSASSLGYTTGSIAAEEITGNITVFVYYMNSMPEDGNDSGVVDGTVNASAVLTTNEKNGLKADEWTNHAMLYRTFAKPVRSWEFSETSAQLEKKGAAYYDPTFGENNFGSFAYVLDPDATQGFDFEVAAAYFAENGGEAAAKAKAIELLKSDNDYITQFNGYVETGSTAVGQYGYKHYGAHDINGQYENWEKPMGNIDNGTLVFIHVADRFGNVCNRIIEWKNYDPYAPVLSTEEAGKVLVTEPGGSGVAKVDLFKDMGTSDSSLYIGYLYDMLHIEGATYAKEGNTFTISAGAENANKHFTVAVTDNAGNVKSIPVNADANGDIVITVTQTFDNVANYKAKPISNVATESGEDLSVIEFVFNGESTVLLNYSEPTSIVKAGPDGNVFANKKNVPLNIITKAEVESVKLYNVATGAEEIWTAENATVKDNGDGTETWTVKYTFAEGEHNYKATAMVDGKWEASSVDFDFTATTKKVSIVTSPIGAGRTELSFNNGSVRMASAYDKVEVPYGSVVKIKATSINESSDFFYWENGYTRRIISTADTTEFIAVANMNLTAQFTTTELITNDKKLVVYVNNAENVVDSYELADGDDYKVPAAPSLAEHVFKSWSMTKDEVLASAEKLIVVRPIYSLVVKNTVTLTEGNWTTTGAGEYETVGDERPVATVSASAADEAGAGFLYWLDAETGEIASYNRTYTFYVIKDTELTPVYGDASAAMPVPVARIATVKYDDKADKVSFFAERSVPAGYTMIQTGIVVTKSESVVSNEDAFVLDASGVSKGTSKSLSASGYYSASVSATSGVTAYARAYVIYANADGDIIHYYSPVSSYTA